MYDVQKVNVVPFAEPAVSLSVDDCRRCPSKPNRSRCKRPKSDKSVCCRRVQRSLAHLKCLSLGSIAACRAQSQLGDTERPFVFDLVTPTRVFTFACESDEELSKWVLGILLACGGSK